MRLQAFLERPGGASKEKQCYEPHGHSMGFKKVIFSDLSMFLCFFVVCVNGSELLAGIFKIMFKSRPHPSFPHKFLNAFVTDFDTFAFVHDHCPQINFGSVVLEFGRLQDFSVVYLPEMFFDIFLHCELFSLDGVVFLLMDFGPPKPRGLLFNSEEPGR
jgi:hypothetical protein